MLRASSTKRSCPPTSTLACRKDNFAASAKCTVHSQASRAENRKRQPIEQHCTACVQDTEGTHHMFTSTTEELADLNSEEQELEIERQKDLDRDASQVVELRALVTEFVNSCKALRLEREEVPSLSGYSECLHPQRNGENVEEAATSTIAISSRVVDNPLLSNGARESALMRFRPPRDEANNKGSSMAESAESRQGIMADILLQVRHPHSNGLFPGVLRCFAGLFCTTHNLQVSPAFAGSVTLGCLPRAACQHGESRSITRRIHHACPCPTPPQSPFV